MDTTSAIKYIVFVLHGWTLKPQDYDDIVNVIHNKFPEGSVKLKIPRLPMSAFSTADPDDIVISILKKIDKEWEKSIELTGTKPNIIIIGHSTGSVLARKVYVAACGENNDAPFEKNYKDKNPKEWAENVERLILLAGMNRGWSINPHLNTMNGIVLRLLAGIGSFLQLFRFKFLAFKTKRGGRFITQLRIQWLSMLRNAYTKKTGKATVVQLLGTLDDIISPEDNVDDITGNTFIYLEVPRSNHLTVLNMNDDPEKQKILKTALIETKEELKKHIVETADENRIAANGDITDVVFVIHGIRDTGYWTQKLARRIKRYGDGKPIEESKRLNKNIKVRKFATETSTYGYFAMLPFALPYKRRQKVEWFMDQYTENLAKYPNAQFSFFGHSNGTHLLAKALKEYPACKFNNVIFAGSVVHNSYEWKKIIESGRIKKFYNYIASSDWVVALFPKTLRMILRDPDLGSGGFDGFTEDLNTHYQLRFIRGGHGAATEESCWDDITRFIVDGIIPEPSSNIAIKKRGLLMKFLGAAAPFPFLFILLIFSAIPVFVFLCIGGWKSFVFLFIYLAIIKKVVTEI